MTNSRQVFRCPSCNGEVKYDPKSRSNVCPFCDTYYVINRFSVFSDFAKDSKASKCSNCDGNLIFGNQKVATCPLCQSKFNIIQEREIDDEEIEEVDLISPFILDTKEAYDRFIRLLSKKSDTPLDLFQRLNISLNTALYTPSVIIRINCDSTYSAKIGFDHNEEYVEYVEVGGKLEKRKRFRVITSWEGTNGSLQENYLFERNITKGIKDISGIDLSRFNEPLNDLCEFNTSHKFEDYNERLLAGYEVLKFEYNEDKIMDDILPLLEKKIQEDINNFIAADHIENLSFRYSYTKNDSLVYIPVYLYKFDYKGKDYYICLTGEDGNLYGDLPSDPEIKSKIDNTMIPFWIYLGVSLFVSFLVIISYRFNVFIIFLLLINLPIYFYFENQKESKISEIESYRHDQAEMFLKGKFDLSNDKITLHEPTEIYDLSDINNLNEDNNLSILNDSSNIEFDSIGISIGENKTEYENDLIYTDNIDSPVNEYIPITENIITNDESKFSGTDQLDENSTELLNLKNFKFKINKKLILASLLSVVLIGFIAFVYLNRDSLFASNESSVIEEDVIEEVVVDYTKLLSAGRNFSVYIDANGSIKGYGENTYNQIEFGNWNDITQIAAGGFHTLGLKSDGLVLSTGYNNYGQINVSSWNDITQVSAGRYHSLGLKSDGTVVCVGENEYGACNVSDWTDIIQVSAGRYNSYGLRSDGKVLSTKDNQYGQANVYDWTGITEISAGTYHIIGLKNDGTVICIGGQEGGNVCKTDTWTDIKQVVGAGYHSIGLKNDGTVVAVGNNDYGQLETSGWQNINAISGGRYHTIALLDDGTIVGVGSNEFDQIP